MYLEGKKVSICQRLFLGPNPQLLFGNTYEGQLIKKIIIVK